MAANNPCNVRRNQIHWLGEIDGSDAFADFDTPADGVRAEMLCVLASYRHHGCGTVAKIIARYAPPGDANPTAAYARFVANRLGLGVDDPVNPADPSTLAAISAAQAWWETHSVIDDATLAQAAASALAK